MAQPATAEQEVRARFPLWTDLQIRRHLEQREALSRLVRQQQRKRFLDSLTHLLGPQQ